MTLLSNMYITPMLQENSLLKIVSFCLTSVFSVFSHGSFPTKAFVAFCDANRFPLYVLTHMKIVSQKKKTKQNNKTIKQNKTKTKTWNNKVQIKDGQNFLFISKVIYTKCGSNSYNM